jgi:hypothetical protein
VPRIVWLAILLGGVLTFALGRLTAPQGISRQAQAGIDEQHRDKTLGKRKSNSRVEQIQRQRAIVLRPLELVQARDDEAAAQLRHYERQQARDMVDLLMQRVQIAGHANPGDPEGAVVAANEYLAGWVDGVIRTAPDLADELAEEVTTMLCGEGTPPAKSLAASRLGLQMPELATSEGLDCVFTRQLREGGLTEDVVLWAALDTWRTSGLPKTPALQAVEAAAKDERTRRRFLAPDDEALQRVAATPPEVPGAASEPPSTSAPPSEHRSPEGP